MELKLFTKVCASILFAFSLSLFTFFAGCNSTKVVQTSHFVNDDGAIVGVSYERAKREHVNTYISPTNGKELEFKSKLAVTVTLPDWPEGVKHEGATPPYDGESFTAWQCMNMRGGGTMYKTDDEEWFFLASGFTCKIAHRDAHYTSGYRDVFSGVLCNTPEKPIEKDTRWKKIRPEQNVKKMAK